MKEHPLLLSQEMVLAYLADRKFVTRRIPGPTNSLVNGKRVSPKKWNALEFDLPNYYIKDGAFWFFSGSTQEWYKVEPIYQSGDWIEFCQFIPGIPKDYCAGINGNIYSKKSGEWKRLKPFINKKLYYSVTPIYEGKTYTKHIHSLVCAAFHGPASNNSMQVRHLDGNQQNNCANNLKWGTPYENWQDRKAHGRGVEGEKHHHSKFTDIERSAIRYAVEKSLCSERHAARMLGVKQCTIHEICKQDGLIEPSKDPGYTGPNWAEVTTVSCERLTDITEEQAIKEGIQSCRWETTGTERYKDYIADASGYGHPEHDYPTVFNPVTSFGTLWESIHGEGSWVANPPVYAINFNPLSKTGRPDTATLSSVPDAWKREND